MSGETLEQGRGRKDRWRQIESLARRSDARRFALFILVGGLNTLVGYAIFALLFLAGAGPVVAAVGATCLGALFNFRTIGLIVFRSRSAGLLPRFLAVYGLQCAANIAALRAMETAGVPLLAAEAVILPLLAVASFVLLRRFVFDAGRAES